MRTGEIISQVSTGSRLANGMFLTPEWIVMSTIAPTFATCRVQWTQN